MAESAPPVAPPASKKKPNRLLVEEATNDDNSVVALNTATMEELCVRAPASPCAFGCTCVAARALSLLAHVLVRCRLLAATSFVVTP